MRRRLAAFTSGARRAIAAVVAWSAPRHRAIEAVLCALCLCTGAALRWGAWAAWLVAGALFFLDLAAEGVAATMSRRTKR